ncbi:MAG: hypothetical protein ACRELZ_07240 [Candidatus Rokuibacteriota bacterium]
MASSGHAGVLDVQWTAPTTNTAGTTSRSWTVTMPPTAGQYEFRLYLNNGFVPQTTSPAVTVVAP